MSESLIQRVARAIYPATFNDAMLEKNFTPAAIAEMQEHAFDKARDVLAAMRKPSEAQAAHMDTLLSDSAPPTRRWHWIWDEMIAKALEEGK